jgi:hypothetical protein
VFAAKSSRAGATFLSTCGSATVGVAVTVAVAVWRNRERFGYSLLMRRAIAAALPIAALLACPSPKPRPVAPSAPGSSNPALSRIARQCALIASCADEHDSSAFRTPESCIDWYVVNARDEAPLASCVIKAASCADLTRCTHPSPAALAEGYCKAHPGVLTACDGSSFLTCQGEASAESTAVDCSALGGTCAERRVGELVVRGCASPKLCPTGAPEKRCDGDAVVDCEDGVVQRDACPPGWRCVAGTDDSGTPTARCASASGRDCGLAGTAFCEGDVAYACVQSGRFTGMHSADCGALGLACVVRSGRVECVRRGPPACSPEPASCVGDDLRFCAAGEPFRVSCKSLGFARCDPAGGGGEALCK